MKSPRKQTAKQKHVVLTNRMEEILRAVHFYRYITAIDVAHLFFSAKSLTHVREILNVLCGGEDDKSGQYLYRFSLPSAKAGNTTKVYTLGSRGRDFLETELGLSADWYFRPDKVKHLSFGQLTHNLILTRFLVAARSFCSASPGYRLAKQRISYGLAGEPVVVELGEGRGALRVPVVPDAWFVIEREVVRVREPERFPVLLEIDRGTEYQRRFKEHVLARVEFIRSGGYERLFGERAVTVAYVTTGDRPSYRETRLGTMRAWTREALEAAGRGSWAPVFRFTAVAHEELFSTPLFSDRVWFEPGEGEPVGLFL